MRLDKTLTNRLLAQAERAEGSNIKPAIIDKPMLHENGNSGGGLSKMKHMAKSQTIPFKQS